jgi:hypothetical protein
MKVMVIGVLKDFLEKEDSQLTETTCCSWMDKNKNLSNKAKIFYFILFYFTTWLLPGVPPKVQL